LITGKAVVARKASADTSVTVACATVGALCLLFVIVNKDTSGDCARVVIVISKFWLLSRGASVVVREFEQVLLTCGGRVDESDVKVITREVDLYRGDGKVRQSFQGILHRLGVDVVGGSWVEHNGSGGVFSTHLVLERKCEEGSAGRSLGAGELLNVRTQFIVTRGLGVITVGASAKGAIKAFVTAVALALLELVALPVVTLAVGTSNLLRVGNDITPHVGVSISAITEENSVVSDAGSVPRARIGASGTSASLASETTEALAFTSGAITKSTSSAFLVNVLVVKGTLLHDSLRLQGSVHSGGVAWFGIGRSVKPIS